MSAFDAQEQVSEVGVALPSSPADRQKLKTMISEATYCLQRADDEKLAVKDIIDVIHSDYGLSKKHARKLITTLYKQNYDDRVAEEEEFEFLYEGLFQTNVKPSVAEAAADALLSNDDDDVPFDT